VSLISWRVVGLEFNRRWAQIYADEDRELAETRVVRCAAAGGTFRAEYPQITQITQISIWAWTEHVG